MTINVSINASEKNALTKNITPVYNLEGTLRDTSNIINPVFVVQSDTPNILLTCNYCEIPDFSRKYFITDFKNIRNNVWEIYCHVDVLSTYANSIRSQTAVVKRQQNNYNLYLDDGIFKTYQNPNIITKAFPSGFDSQSFVLAVAGG